MALLDVNALVALAWDSHIHHGPVVAWFQAHAEGKLGPTEWYTCPVTESGFVRVSSNPRVLPVAIGVSEARQVLGTLRLHEGHRFLVDDVSLTDPDVPDLVGYRQVTDGHLITLARRQRVDLVTFDRSAAVLAGGRNITLLTR
jgi:toxin-antitoxin system PIN domain toxin